MLDKKVSFQMEAILPEWLEDYDDNKFTVFKTCFLSTAKNSHNLEISEEVLRRDASTILGNFLVAKVQFGDAGTHSPTEIIYGYFPKEQEVEFEETDDSVVKAWAYCVISKQYGKDFNDIFNTQNLRNTSVEMKVKVEDDADEGTVESLDIYGLTCLGMSVDGSCPDAMMTMVRFSQEEADDYFKGMNKQNLTPLKKFVKERIENMADEKFVNHPIDTSKDAIYEGEWDGQKAKQDLIKEEKFKTLAPKVCMKLEDGWEDREITKLGYPVMMLHEGKWVYSTKGLSSALGYAKKEDETEVINKIEKIYKKLGLDGADGKEEKMAKEIEFSAVDISDMWGRLWYEIDETRHWEYGIVGVFEEDNKKFAVLRDRDGKLYRLDFSLTEDGMTVADEVIEVKQDFIDTDNVKKFAKPEDADRYCKFSNLEEENEEEVKMSEDEMLAKIAQLEKDIEERDNIIMEKETELCDLRAFKQACMEAERGAKVDAIMLEVSKYLDKSAMESYRNEGLTCDFAEVDAWANKVKAVVFEKVTKQPENAEFTRMSAAVEIKKSTSVWDRLGK